MTTTGDAERRVWAAILFATGQADVFGAVRGSPRLHWSFDGARLEAEGWAEAMQAGPVAWARIEDEIAVGRIKGTPSCCAVFCCRSDRRRTEPRPRNY